MYIIGITGGSGTGKTVALSVLEKMGVVTFDCDKVYHELLCENEIMKSEIEAAFNGVLTDGVIDRKKLGGIVFNDKAALQKLNNITHRYVVNEVTVQLDVLAKQGNKAAAIDAVALIESGANKICNITVGFVAPLDKRITRIMERDSIYKETAELRVMAQQPDEFYKNHCDIIVNNSFDTIEEFEEYCKKIFTDVINPFEEYCKKIFTDLINPDE